MDPRGGYRGGFTGWPRAPLQQSTTQPGLVPNPIFGALRNGNAPSPYPASRGLYSRDHVAPNSGINQSLTPFQQSQLSAATLEDDTHLGPFNRSSYADGFETVPFIHEGFVPAPGHEDDDDGIEAPYRLGNEKASASNYDQDQQSDDDYDFEWDNDFLDGLLNGDNSSDDADYTEDEGDTLDDPDEMMFEEILDEDEETRPKRGRPKPKPLEGSLDKAFAQTPDDIPRKRSARSSGRKARRPRRVPKERKRGRPKGRQPNYAKPSPEFQELTKLANDAYVRGDAGAAIDYAQKAIKLNPEIFAAHSLLSEAYEQKGEHQKAVEALILGAPTKRDKELWYYIIEKIRGMRQTAGFTRHARLAFESGCLAAIIKMDKNDWDARNQQLEVQSLLGENYYSRCVKQCQKMLSLRPHDVRILTRMATLGTATPRLAKIHLVNVLRTFELSIAQFKDGEDPSTSQLDWSLLNVYLDLLDRTGNYARALCKARELARWIQGRAGETFWDDHDDDREFDAEDEPRRAATPEFSRPSDSVAFTDTMPLEIRSKFGIFRLRQTPPQLPEAMRHFEMLEPGNDAPNAPITDYGDLFRAVADALCDLGWHAEALRFYEPLHNRINEEIGLRSYLGFHSCYANLGLGANADDLLPVFLEWSSEDVKDVAILAKFFERQGMQKEARQRGEMAYKMNGFRALQAVEYEGLADIQKHFFEEKRRGRGSWRAKKSRVRKHLKTLKDVTAFADDLDGGHDAPVSLALKPLKEGLYLFPKRKAAKQGSLTFQRSDIENFAGTDIPLDAVDQRLFQQRLERIAEEHEEELKEYKKQHREIVASFRRLEEITPAAENGEEDGILEYVSIARELIQAYSAFDLFYYNKKDRFRSYFKRVGKGELWKGGALMCLAVADNNKTDDKPIPDLSEKPDQVPEDFYGIHFDKWLEVFCSYATFLARKDDVVRCFSVIDMCLRTNVFYWSRDYSEKLQKVRLACAIALDDSVQAVAAVRWFMKTYPFSTDMFRLYSDVSRMCLTSDGFSSSVALKYLMRYIKATDYAMLLPDQRQLYNFQGDDNTTWFFHAVTSGMIDKVKDHDPALFALFGHAIAAGGSHNTALNYYFRAYALTPEDAILNLSIGVAFIEQAAKRLSANRQHQTRQGLSFIYKYYHLRVKDDVAAHCSEAEFNLGRIWHALGLLTEAVAHYERCIALSDRVKQDAKAEGKDASEVEDFATDAAFALQQIFALSGNFRGALEVTEEVLIIE
ncbi:TPR-like protein [Polyplosphaeria fusca]|uniref:TPR-like protein n=1 Tax=Polyplosphaeria fusca TaxID=682080 RepID=A0A9P4UXE2_9PLEO|nr:TPR-like protein [Polyplosphaeria fusca]